MSPDYGLKIAEDFQKYLKTGDDSLVAGYSAKELRVAISKLSPYYNHNKLWYRALERRIRELNSREEAQRESLGRQLEDAKKKWLVKALFFGAGVVVGVLI